MNVKMEAYVVTNTEGQVRGISTWGENYAWAFALNKIPDGVTVSEIKQAFKSIGWKCTKYLLTKGEDL